MSRVAVVALWLIGLMCLGYVIDISVDLYRGQINAWGVGSFLLTFAIWVSVLEIHKQEVHEERMEQWWDHDELGD